VANIEIKTNITAPTNITVPLVRADYLAMSNVFRIIFEIFLALTASLFGSIFTLDSPAAIHWAFFAVTGTSTIVFLVLSAVFHKKAVDECAPQEDHPRPITRTW